MHVTAINSYNTSKAFGSKQSSFKGDSKSTLEKYGLQKDDMNKSVIVGGVSAILSLFYAIKDKSAHKIRNVAIGFAVATVFSQLTFMSYNYYMKRKAIKLVQSNSEAISRKTSNA